MYCSNINLVRERNRTNERKRERERENIYVYVRCVPTMLKAKDNTDNDRHATKRTLIMRYYNVRYT